MFMGNGWGDGRSNVTWLAFIKIILGLGGEWSREKKKKQVCYFIIILIAGIKIIMWRNLNPVTSLWSKLITNHRHKVWSPAEVQEDGRGSWWQFQSEELLWMCGYDKSFFLKFSYFKPTCLLTPTIVSSHRRRHLLLCLTSLKFSCMSEAYRKSLKITIQPVSFRHYIKILSWVSVLFKAFSYDPSGSQGSS